MPLCLAPLGEEQKIKKVGGSLEIKTHLEDMGFVVGAKVVVISTMGGNLIVKVKDVRVAVSREMASRIIV